MSVRFAKIGLIALSMAGFVGAANRQPRHNAPPQEVITRMPGEPPRHWRSMRTVWKVWPGSNDTEDHMQDMTLRGDRLYYRCPSEAGCIQTATGRYLWRHPFYALSLSGELAALNIANGHRLWTRQSTSGGSPSEAVFLLGDRVLSDPGGEFGAVRKRDGRSLAPMADSHKFENVSKEPFAMPWLSDTAQDRNPTPQLFEAIYGMRLINGVPRNLRSNTVSETLVMLDAATGAERWRWQPEGGGDFEKILSDGHRIFIQDYDSIRAVEDGPGPRLPTAPDKRRTLARFLVQAVFQGYGRFNEKKGRWVYVTGFGRSEKEAPDASEATLNLVKMGADSVPAVMEQVHQDVAERDKRLPSPKELSFPLSPSSDSLSEAMDLLTDIGDRSCVPGLIAELSRAKHPLSRMTLARALIRLGDARALPALMQYARTSPNDPNTRLDALYAIAKSARDTPVRNDLTQFLLTTLGDASAPAFLRLFARFELLNNRGSEARAAARVAFKAGKPTSLIPKGVTLTPAGFPDVFDRKVQNGFPTQVYIMSTARDTSGKIWGAFYSDYLGCGGDLWFAQSKDGTHWTHPMFAMNTEARCSLFGRSGPVKIRCVGDVMVVNWDESDVRNASAKPLAHADRLALADIERDSDGDGLNDLLKLEIGLDLRKHNAKDQANPGNEDKNAAVRSEPETNEAGIFRSAVEALCQVGRDGDPSTKPVRFGGCTAPLALPMPPGSHGVTILGHPGPVVFRRITSHHSFPGSLYSAAGYSFIAPHIDLKGYYHDPTEKQLALNAQPQDPYANPDSTMPQETQASFRDYFPYEISADGTRARVGWEQRLGGIMDECGIGFDIEARKIAGRWYPVECRRIFAYGRHWREEAVIPDTRPSTVLR